MALTLRGQVSRVRSRSNAEPIVALFLEERSGIRRIDEPVTVGLPFPQGMVSDPSFLSLWDASGCQLSLQACPLAQWFDGSLKWVLLDFQADVEPNTLAKYQLRYGTGQSTRRSSPDRRRSL